MLAMQYLTIDGWQWVLYQEDNSGRTFLCDHQRLGMMPVAKSEAELWSLLRDYGWEPKGTHRVCRMDKSYQCRIVTLTVR